MMPNMLGAITDVFSTWQIILILVLVVVIAVLLVIRKRQV